MAGLASHPHRKGSSQHESASSTVPGSFGRKRGGRVCRNRLPLMGQRVQKDPLSSTEKANAFTITASILPPNSGPVLPAIAVTAANAVRARGNFRVVEDAIKQCLKHDVFLVVTRKRDSRMPFWLHAFLPKKQRLIQHSRSREGGQHWVSVGLHFRYKLALSDEVSCLSVAVSASS